MIPAIPVTKIGTIEFDIASRAYEGMTDDEIRAKLATLIEPDTPIRNHWNGIQKTYSLWVGDTHDYQLVEQRYGTWRIEWNTGGSDDYDTGEWDELNAIVALIDFALARIRMDHKRTMILPILKDRGIDPYADFFEVAQADESLDKEG